MFDEVRKVIVRGSLPHIDVKERNRSTPFISIPRAFRAQSLSEEIRDRDNHLIDHKRHLIPMTCPPLFVSTYNGWAGQRGGMFLHSLARGHRSVQLRGVLR